MTAWMTETVVSKSATSVLIDTFMTDWSSTMTNCAVARATNGNQRFIGALTDHERERPRLAGRSVDLQAPQVAPLGQRHAGPEVPHDRHVDAAADGDADGASDL